VASLGSTEAIPGVDGLLVLAVGWGVLPPLLFRLTTILRR